jgi:hypothetical protein
LFYYYAGSSVDGSFPDGTRFQARVTTGNVISVNVPIVLQNITSCRGDYTVTAGEVLGVKPSSGGGGGSLVPSGSGSVITPYGVSGTISLLDASVTPVVCKDIDFYYQCAQSYTVQVSGSKMTLTPSSSAPSSCGVGTGDISGTLMLVNARHRRD